MDAKTRRTTASAGKFTSSRTTKRVVKKATSKRDRPDVSVDQLRSQLREVFDSVVDECASELAAAGRDLDDLGGADAIHDAVRAVLPRPNRFAARVGPVYTTGQLRRLLPGVKAEPVKDQAVYNRLDDRRLVGAKTRDNRWVFPVWQFRVRPSKLVVREDVLELWQLLPAEDDPVTGATFDTWTLLAWMTGPRSDLDGHSPLSWLDEHGLDQHLRRAAGQVRARAVA